MKILSVYFNRKPVYGKLRRMFENSLSESMPEMRYTILESKKPSRVNPRTVHQLDTETAFQIAANHAMSCRETIAVADIDLCWLRKIDDIEQRNFDIAVTTRNSRMRYNTGLWFYRPTEKARRFLQYWADLARQFAKEYDDKKDDIRAQGGIDQYALYVAMDAAPEIGATVIELPCHEWNAEQSSWKYVNNDTRVLHVKSALRQAFNGKDIDDPTVNRLAKIAQRYL